MIRTLTAVLLLAAASSAAAADRRFPIDDFDRVIVEGPYVVHLVTGRASMASANGTREALDRLTLDVQGQTLRIRRNRSGWVGTAGADAGIVTIELATRNLRSARLVGPARFEGSGTLRAIGVDADNLSLALLGSGRLEVAGAARVLRGNFQGSGEIAATALRAGNATVTTTTSGTVALTVNGPATITANGLAEVRIYGRPDCTIRGIAADQVRCGGGSDQGQHR